MENQMENKKENLKGEKEMENIPEKYSELYKLESDFYNHEADEFIPDFGDLEMMEMDDEEGETMTNISSNNRVVFGVTTSGRGWNVWNSVSVNWGTWSTNRVSGFFTTREQAVMEAVRQSRSEEFEGWQVSFDFQD